MGDTRTQNQVKIQLTKPHNWYMTQPLYGVNPLLTCLERVDIKKFLWYFINSYHDIEIPSIEMSRLVDSGLLMG